MYGALLEESKKSNIFPIDAYGYRRITVERPLQLNFQTSEERIERRLAEKALQKLDDAEQSHLLSACRTMDATTLYRNRKAFQKPLKAALLRVYPAPAAGEN